MSGKPPLGSGNKRWNLGNSSNKINEKKEILKAIDDIYNIIERNSNLTTTTELSDILYKLSKLTIPNKQINLTKEIASSCRAIGRIPTNLLKPGDYASISRYLTRTSSEKQLTLTSREAPLLYDLFASFLHSINPTNSIDESQPKLLILHEVMRAFAQMIAESGNHLYGKKFDLIEIIDRYSASPDLETRYSALDALGNFFKTTSVNIIESSLIDKNANDSVDQKALHSQGEPTEIPTNTEREINSISAFLKRCLSILVNNLQYCESYILHAETFLEGGVNNVLIQKLLISVFRAIAYAYSSPFACFKGISTAVGKPTILGELRWRQELFREPFDITLNSFIPLLHYFLSISQPSRQSCNFPNLEKSEINAENRKLFISTDSPQTTPSYRPPSPANSVCSVGSLSPGRNKQVSSEETCEKVLQHAFYLIESMAKFDSVSAVKFWPLLLIPSSKNACNLFDYLIYDVLSTSHESNKKHLNACASAITSLLIDFSRILTQFSQENDELKSSLVVTMTLESLISLFCIDHNATRITSYLSMLNEIFDFLAKLQSYPVLATLFPTQKCENFMNLILKIILHRSLELIPCSPLNQISRDYSFSWNIPLHRNIPDIHIATLLFDWLKVHFVKGSSDENSTFQYLSQALQINLNLSNNSSIGKYMSLITQSSILQQTKESKESTSDTTSSVATSTSTSTSSEPSSYLFFFLNYCQFIFGMNNCQYRHEHDPESEIGKLELAVITFLSSIASNDFCLLFPYFSDIEKMISFGLLSSFTRIRIICIDMIGSIIKYTSPEPPVLSSNSTSWLVQCCTKNISLSSEWILSLIQDIITSSNDVDVLVRIQSIHTMKFIAILWSNWRWNTSRISSNTSKNTKNENDENLFYHLTQFYQQIYSILMKLLSDNSYEVQILSCKIIGELITSHSFWLDNEIFSYILHIDHHIIYENLHNLLQICLQSLENLLESPKIPMRIQAIWTYGNTIRNLLPYRLLFIREKLSQKFFSLRGRIIGNIYSFNDPGENFGQNLFCENVRSRLFEIIEFDNEKITPAAIRVLSLITLGLLPHSYRSQEYIRLVNFLLFGSHRTSPPSMTWQLTWTSEYILENILLQKISHHKLLYSLCQLLCSYLWSTILYDNTTCDSTDRDEGDVGDDDENLMTSEYYYHLLLCLFRQNHFIKIRIQSLKCLIVLNQLLYEKICIWKSYNTKKSFQRIQFYLKFSIKCVEDSLLLLLIWSNDIPSQMDLSDQERHHLREYLISLLILSLHCIHLIFRLYSSTLFPSSRDAIITVLFHSLHDFVTWLQNEELRRFQASDHSITQLLTPLSIDTVLEIELEANLIPSSPNFHSNIPNPHEFDFIIIQSLNELMAPMDPEEYSHAYTPYALKKIEITDTVKQLAILFLQIFEKCEKKSLLQSIQHINQTLFLSSGVVLHDDTKHILSATPYHILLSICDPSSLQYGDDDDHDDNCIKNTSNDNKITKEGNHSFIMLQYHARRIGQMLSSPYQEKDKTNEDEDEI